MSTPITLDSLSALDDLFFPLVEEKQEETGQRFIIHEKRIDKLTVKRDRVLMTPAVCDVCGLDILNLAYIQNKIATNVWDEVPENIRLLLSQAVEKHKSQLHSEAEKLITTSRPKKWLSGRQI